MTDNHTSGSSSVPKAPILERQVTTVQDPFKNKSIPWSAPGEILKTVLVVLTLFPIRLSMFLVFLLLGFLSAMIASIGVPRQQTKPFGWLRRALVFPCRLSARGMLWCFGFWWIDVKRGHTKGANVLVVSPHRSLLDVFYFIYAYAPSAIAKAAVRSIPLFGRGAIALQTIFVDRKSHDSKKKALEDLKERASNPKWPKLLVFPEGTCTNASCLVSFKQGAFAPGEPVLPVVLRYPFKCVDPSTVFATASADYKLLLRLMLQWSNKMQVQTLEVYTPSEEEREQPLLFAANVQKKMAAELGVPITQHSYDDVFLMAAAQPAQVAQSFQMASFQKRFGLDLDAVKLLVERFHKSDVLGDGCIHLEEFEQALQLQDWPSVYSRRLFNFFDSQQQGVISFQDFVEGMHLTTPEGDETGRLTLSFLLYDLDSSGAINWSNVQERTAMAERLGLSNTMNITQEDFMAFDADKDGALNKTEFQTLVQKHPTVLSLPLEIAKQKIGTSMDDVKQRAAEIREKREAKKNKPKA